MNMNNDRKTHDYKQYWEGRLQEFLRYIEDTAKAQDPANVVADLRSVVRRWITHSSQRPKSPGEQNEMLLSKWVTKELNLGVNAQADCKSRVRRWWTWCEDKLDDAPGQLPSVPERPPEEPAVECGELYATNKWGPDYCACGTKNKCEIEPGAATYKICKKTDTVVWVGDPIDRKSGNRVVQRTEQPTYRAGDKWFGKWFGTRDSLTLEGLVERYREAAEYPTEDDRQHKAARVELAEILSSLESLPYEERERVKRVWTNDRYDYGGVGITANLHRTVNDCSSAEWESIRSLIYDLCYDDSDLASRFDDCVLGITGLGELVATRLLAVSHPQRFIPNYILRQSPTATARWSRPGKLEMIELLVELEVLNAEQVATATTLLNEPESHPQPGALVIGANDFLVDVLGPYFPDTEHSIDAWGIARFLYWFAEQYVSEEDLDDDSDDDDDFDELDNDSQYLEAALVRAADDLLCEVSFVRSIVELLQDKGQVILYGPPGTGKTYFAQTLAKALVGGRGGESAYGESVDDSGDDLGVAGYSLVQFHPAYSYEDFFEGFRPQVDDDGNMTYELVPGPLVRLAQRASACSGELHVMMIDEINRANLPRVLGELLYLLEYRDESVQTQYRPEEKFLLPNNLWFIGTMNTADRSIALIDAAMRRRFHFVKFSPVEEPTKSLLGKWLERKAPNKGWVAGLLKGVNGRLAAELGDDHLLIGPSHFMTKHPDRDLTEEGVRRIWTYNIEPLIEDQFFGRQDVIKEFRFDAIWQRYGPDAAVEGDASGTEDPMSEL